MLNSFWERKIITHLKEMGHPCQQLKKKKLLAARLFLRNLQVRQNTKLRKNLSYAEVQAQSSKFCFSNVSSVTHFTKQNMKSKRANPVPSF